VRKPEVERPFARPRHRWEDNIRMGFQEVRWGASKWRALVNAALNFRVP